MLMRAGPKLKRGFINTHTRGNPCVRDKIEGEGEKERETAQRKTN